MTAKSNLKDGTKCKVIGGTHKGKSGTVGINTSKTGAITITVIQANGERFKTLAEERCGDEVIPVVWASRPRFAEQPWARCPRYRGTLTQSVPESAFPSGCSTTGAISKSQSVA